MNKCWYCGKELKNENNKEHIGICDKCYQESFEVGNKFVSNLIEKQTDKDQKIADLEAKLAESEEKCKKAYREGLLQKQFDKDMEIDQLKQQLAEKEKEIEEIKQIISKYTDKLPDNVAFDIANDDIRYQIVSNLIDKNTNYRNQIKELRQAKTDFAIEQLEKVRTQFRTQYTWYEETHRVCEKTDNFIIWLDQQIKELKGKTNVKD